MYPGRPLDPVCPLDGPGLDRDPLPDRVRRSLMLCIRDFGLAVDLDGELLCWDVALFGLGRCQHMKFINHLHVDI
jgi:hypothetical protein